MPITSMGDSGGGSRRYSSEPILRQSIDFLAGTEADHDIDDGLSWESFYRQGCPPQTHLKKEEMSVLIRDLPTMVCLSCGSAWVGIIYKQGCVSPHSGDAYYDVELRCAECGTYSVYSYAEN